MLRLHLVSLLAPEWPLATVQIAPRSGSDGPDPVSPAALAADSLLRGLQAGAQSSGKSYGLTSPSTCTFCPHLLLSELRDTFRNLLSGPHLVLGALPGAKREIPP